MKAIMYHYVRPDAGAYPYFRFLALDDFRRQLDYFGETFGFVDRAGFERALRDGRPADGAVLTFDDGVLDHVDHVLPELVARGLWGIFYVSTGIYSTRKILDVHRTHLLIGKAGGAAVLARLQQLVVPDMLSGAKREEFSRLTYTRQDNDDATNTVKRILNYFLDYEHRERVIDALVQAFLDNAECAVDRFYMSVDQLRQLDAAGMTVGSHTVTHRLLSRLDEREQQAEIADSFGMLEAGLGPLSPKTFCYPYGGFHSFTDTTERLLTENGCDFAFNVEQRDVSADDLTHRPQALPRYDCNQFAHGQSKLAITG